MNFDFYKYIFYLPSSIFVILGCILLIIPLPPTDSISKFSNSLKLLSIAYFSLAIYCLTASMIEPQLLSPNFLFIASLQMNFLTYAHLNVINPTIINVKYTLKKTIPICILFLLYLIVRLFVGNTIIDNIGQLFPWSENCLWITDKGINFEVLLRVLWFFYYIGAIIYFFYHVRKEYHDYTKRLDDFSSESPQINFRMINISFFIITFISFISICISCSIDFKFRLICNIVMLVSYCLVGFIYIQFPKNYLVISEAIPNPNKDNTEIKPDLSEDKLDLKWNCWKENIIQQNWYKENGITLNQIAQLLGTNRTELSYAINQFERKNFNTYINSLRIEEAKKLMKESNIPISEICIQLGYSDPANFSRRFKEQEGISPLAWRKNSQ
ncbi:MAG: AraC family transcriptional regulator [Paludibacteraceae bacterium]|nr:AraC family transcriptional regulator [Paludibacteraceae bacterium]